MNKSFIRVFEEFNSSNLVLLFLLFCLIHWLFNFVNSEFIATEELYDQYLEQRQIEKYGKDYDELADEFEDDLEDVEEDDEYYWSDQAWDFGIMSLLKLIQFTIITAFIFVGLTLKSETDKLSFAQILKVIVIAEFIFFIPALIKAMWFGFIAPANDYLEIRSFHPFSLLSVIGSDNVNDWMIYPLRTINLFEIIYVYAIIIGIHQVSNLKLASLTKPIILSYSLMLFMWISIRVYLSTTF